MQAVHRREWQLGVSSGANRSLEGAPIGGGRDLGGSEPEEGEEGPHEGEGHQKQDDIGYVPRNDPINKYLR